MGPGEGFGGVDEVWIETLEDFLHASSRGDDAAREADHLVGGAVQLEDVF